MKLHIIDRHEGTYNKAPFSEVLTGTVFYKNYRFWLKTENEDSALNLENGISYCFAPDTLVIVFPYAELIIK